jgi:hypothetical protein
MYNHLVFQNRDMVSDFRSVRYSGFHSLANNTTKKNTDLDRQSLSYCVSLIENGVNPEALAVSRITIVALWV